MNTNVITIGHAGLSQAGFLEILKIEEVRLLADLRQFPVSRHQPEFNRAKISKWLQSHGIEYVFLGNGLGNIPEKILRLESAAVQINANSPEFRAFSHDLGKLLAHLNAPEKVAILGSRSEPFICPRFYQISPLLQSLGFSVTHILTNGSKTPNWQLELDLPGMAQLGATEAPEKQKLRLLRAYSLHRQTMIAQNVSKKHQLPEGKDYRPDDYDEEAIRRKRKYLHNLSLEKTKAA